MDKEIVIGGEATINAELEGETKIDTAIDGEFGWCYAIAPVPPSPEPTELVIKDVMFMDYDGSVVASYDAADFIANVTALPTPPAHDGLTFQEWNWTLADIKTELQTGSGACCIGACYETTDGKTHFFIDLKQEDGVLDIQFYRIIRSGTLTVDWGDGTVETVSGNNLTKHTYTDYGTYDIAVTGQLSISATSRFMRAQGTTSLGYEMSNKFLTDVRLSSDCRLYANGSGNNTFMVCTTLKTFSVCKEAFSFSAINVPFSFQSVFKNTDIRFFVFPKGTFNDNNFVANYSFNNCFNRCRSLITVSFPKLDSLIRINQGFGTTGMYFLYIPSVTTFDAGNGYLPFDLSYNLQRFAAKGNFTTTYTNGFYATFQHDSWLRDASVDKMSFGNNYWYSTFYNCYSYSKEVVIPSGVTRLNGVFYECYSIPKVKCLGDLTSIAANTFFNCYSCTEYDFTNCTTVPTLANTNAFTGINPTAKIKVPASLEASWKTAANWSTYASYIVGV